MDYPVPYTMEQKINNILERVERIEKMLEKLTGDNYSSEIPVGYEFNHINPTSSAGVAINNRISAGGE